MLLICNINKIRNWKFSPDKQCGIYYGIEWEYIGFFNIDINEEDNSHFFRIKKDDEVYFPRIRDSVLRKDMTIRELIENYIDEWYR